MIIRVSPSRQLDIISRILLFFICSTLYMFSAINNARFIEEILIINEASSSILQKIYHYTILSYGVTGLVLFIFINQTFFQKITALHLLVYITSSFAIGFLEFSFMTQIFYSVIYSSTNLLIITKLICYLFQNKIFKKDYLPCFFILSFSCAYVFSRLIFFYNSLDIFLIEITTIHKLIIMNIIAIIIFVILVIWQSYFRPLKSKSENTLLIFQNINLEMIASFCIFYILMSNFYHYEIYQFTDTLLTITTSEIKYYILAAMIFTLILSSKFIFRFNYHKINLISLLMLLLCFSTIFLWNNNLIISSFCWFVIGMSFYLYFFANFLILAKKFTGNYLQTAITLYISSGAAGYYCGYVVASNIENIDNEYNILRSNILILVGLAVYYLFHYTKYNLKKW